MMTRFRAITRSPNDTSTDLERGECITALDGAIGESPHAHNATQTRASSETMISLSLDLEFHRLTTKGFNGLRSP